MKKKDEKNQEITSFNDELVSFDLEDLTVDVLEHRFELAVAAVYDAAVCNLCDGLACSGVDCSGLACKGFVIVPEQPAPAPDPGQMT